MRDFLKGFARSHAGVFVLLLVILAVGMAAEDIFGIRAEYVQIDVALLLMVYLLWQVVRKGH